MIKHIPNSITLMNLVSGFLAILITCIYEDENRINLAVILVLAAVFFDIIDGLVARVLKVTSDLGKDLDSLSDLVSFGVAPALLIFMTYFQDEYTLIGFLVVVLFPVFGAYRLARFNNIKTPEKNIKYFKGLPITFAGILAVALVSLNEVITIPVLVVALAMVTISLLMVANLKVPSLKSGNIHLKLFILFTIIYFLSKGL